MKDSKFNFSSNSLYSSSSFIKLKKSLNNEIKFDNFAEEKLINFRDKILKFLENSKITINKTYNKYIDFINKYISDKEKKMKKINEYKKNSNIKNRENRAKDTYIKKNKTIYIQKHLMKDL